MPQPHPPQVHAPLSSYLIHSPCPYAFPGFYLLYEKIHSPVSVLCPLLFFYLIRRSIVLASVPCSPCTLVFIYLIRRSTVLVLTNCFLSTPLSLFQTHIFPSQWIFLFISFTTTNFTSVPVLCASADL